MIRIVVVIAGLVFFRLAMDRMKIILDRQMLIISYLKKLTGEE